MGELKLTANQQAALERLQLFTQTPGSRCFVLRGYAGTGKTTLVGNYVRWLDQEMDVKAILLATTGRAAKVLANKTGMQAKTIHSCIYQFDELGGLESDTPKEGQLTLQFGIRQKPQVNKEWVYIVDEASMIANTAAKSGHVARFGSGHLLVDFLEFTSPHRVVFVGDPCQLPPVSTDAFSPALSPRYLRDHYNVAVHYAELYEIVRQNRDSEILRLAGKFRQDIVQNNYIKWPKLLIPTQQQAHLHKNEHVLIEKYLDFMKRKAYDEALMITNSNNHCRRLNHRMRMTLHGDKNLREGELLMVVQNSYYVPLSNGDQVRVEKVEPYGKRAGFFFLKVNLKNVNSDEKYETLLIKELLYNNYAGLQADEAQRLIIDFDKRARQKGIKRKSQVYKELMRVDPYLNALRAKFGYVITCHKSQGGEWPQVFLNIQKSVFGMESNPLYRWFYTALTRASDHLHINDGFWVYGFNKRQPEAVKKFFQKRQREQKNKRR